MVTSKINFTLSQTCRGHAVRFFFESAFDEGNKSFLCLTCNPGFSCGQQQSPVKRFQNSVAPAVIRTPKSSHITPVLKSLHWLKIKERIKYKLEPFSNL